MPTPAQAGPAPDQQERLTTIALLLNKLVLAAHARGYQEGREYIHEDDRITGKEVDDLERKILEQAERLEADLTAVRAQLEQQIDHLTLQVDDYHARANQAEAALTAARAQLEGRDSALRQAIFELDEAEAALAEARQQLAALRAETKAKEQ